MSQITKRASFLVLIGLLGAAGLGATRLWSAETDPLAFSGPGLATAQQLAQQFLDSGIYQGGISTLTTIRTQQETPRATLCAALMHITYSVASAGSAEPRRTPLGRPIVDGPPGGTPPAPLPPPKPPAQWDVPIDYTIELTDDGQIFVTLLPSVPNANAL
jgi:hypothetical protein